MSDSTKTAPETGNSCPRHAPRWFVARWRRARVATEWLVEALRKPHSADEDGHARDREERVFHPREH